jgi:hypothetical protein
MARKGVSVLAICLAFFGPVAWGQRSNPPVRLAVLPDRTSVYAGEQVNVTLELRDAYNQAARAPKDFEINLELRLQDRVLERQIVRIRRGESSTRAVVPVREPGIALIKATHPELREDAAYVRARRGCAAVAPMQSRPGRARASCSAPPQSPPQPQPLYLDVLYSDMGAKLTANGSDRAKIAAFLTDAAPRDLNLRFFSDSGLLTPNPLVIPSGADFGETYLSSEKVGAVKVSYIHSNADHMVRLRSGGEKDIRFDLAIKEISLKASPPSVPLGDSTEIQAEILDLHGTPIQLPEARKVYLALDSGLGDFAPNPIEIAANTIQGQTHFTPRKMGTVRISASSYGAPTWEAVAVEVYFPALIAILIFVFGAVPSGLRILVKPVGVRTAVVGAAVGGFTALAVCGLAVFGLYKYVPPQVALHPIGASVVAMAVGLGMMPITTKA